MVLTLSDLPGEGYCLMVRLKKRRDHLSGEVVSLLNGSLREYVVGGTTKASLTVAEMFELLADTLTSSRIGCFIGRRLELLALDADGLDILSRVHMAIGVRGKMLHAKEVVGFTRRQVVKRNNSHQQPPAG